MKRTFSTAAAVLAAGGVGAVGMATPALAAGEQQLPASIPTDNGVANTAFHAAGTLASAQKTVGDVVPLDQQLSGRSGDPVTDALGSTPAGGVLKPVIETLGQATSGQTQGLDPMSAVEQAAPVGQTLPAGKSGDATAPVTNTVGQLPVAGDLPVGKTGAVDGVLPTSLTGSLENLEPVATPQTKPGQLPATDVVGGTLSNVVENAGTQLPAGRSGDPVSGLLGSTPLGQLPVGGDVLGGVTGNLPVGKAGSPVDSLPVAGDVLGGVTGNLPVGKSGSPVDSLPVAGDALGGVTDSLPVGKAGSPVDSLPVGGDVLGGVTDSLPVGKSGSPVDEVTGLVSHGPVGGVTQLGS